MFLSRTVFHCGVFELLGRLSAHEEALWMAEYAISPWGEFRSDLQAGQVMSAVINANPWAKPEHPVTPFDALMFEEKKLAPPKGSIPAAPDQNRISDPEEMKLYLQAYCRMTGGEVKNGV